MINKEEIEEFSNGSAVDGINYVLQKLVRDFIVNALVAAPMIVVDGEVHLELFLPTLGMVVYRTCRDVLPKVYAEFKSRQ